MASSRIRRGGIFLKLFAGLWTTFVAIALSVYIFSTSHQQLPRHYGQLDPTPFAARAVGTALAVFDVGGEEALVRWLSDKRTNFRPEVFAISDSGEELIGRTVPEKALAQVRDTPGKSVTSLRVGERTLRLFAVRTDIPPRRKDLLSAFWRTPFWIQVLIALIATCLVAGLLAWSFSRPIRQLDWAMKRAAEGDLNVRISSQVRHHYDEISELAERYDEMAEKINGLIARQKRLFHDVSHELRSPLARIEVAIGLADQNPDRREECLRRIEREVGTLDSLVEELLTYARLDDNAPLTFERMDIAPVLEAVAENAAFEGSARNVSVRLESGGPAEVSIHVDSIARAVENLVRNALRFSPDGGTVSIEASRSARALNIVISDEGPGMPAEVMEKVFLPFVRGSDQKTGSGFGLGMAIAKRAVERNGGSIRAENRRPHGLRIVITLPLSGS